ncbi:MAG: carboxypeptidase-like regulatory domain-containing protein, partial [Sphingobacteriales bacterium]|nr:carboxypeptidase-like regulatory domain-containing protein [Sphingobacteriales bacterium]
MRNNLFFLFFFYCSPALYAGKISGTVTDTSGRVLPFASVFIKGLQKGTNSNNEGKYSLQLSPGQYIIVCQYVGYRKEERPVTVTGEDLKVDFRLVLQEMTLGEVILGRGEDPAYEIIRQTIKKRKQHP